MPVDGGLLETLLWECFEGPNECSPDEGLCARIQDAPAGSAVLTFRLDDKRFRAAVGLDAQGKKCCDRLIMVVHKPAEGDPRLTFFLIEMKGRDLPHALAQLGDTADALRERLSHGRTRIIAVIVSDRATSSLPKPDMDRFRKEHRVSIFVRSGVRNGVPADLSSLLNPRASRAEPDQQVS